LLKFSFIFFAAQPKTKSKVKEEEKEEEEEAAQPDLQIGMCVRACESAYLEDTETKLC